MVKEPNWAASGLFRSADLLNLFPNALFGGMDPWLGRVRAVAIGVGSGARDHTASQQPPRLQGQGVLRRTPVEGSLVVYQIPGVLCAKMYVYVSWRIQLESPFGSLGCILLPEGAPVAVCARARRCGSLGARNGVGVRISA